MSCSQADVLLRTVQLNVVNPAKTPPKSTLVCVCVCVCVCVRVC